MLRAHISQYDGSVGMRVRRCFSFSDLNTTVELVDHRGCPDRSIMSHFQCDIVICKGECQESDCDDPPEDLPSPQARSLQPQADARVQSPGDDGALMASYSVFVVEPGAVPVERSEACQDCSLGPVWLLYLC